MGLDLVGAAAVFGGAVTVSSGRVEVVDAAVLRSEAMDRLVWSAVFGERAGAGGGALAALGAGADDRGAAGLDPRPLPRARAGRVPAASPCRPSTCGCWPTTRRARCSARPKALDGGAVILEIARSEIGYTDQRPAEYVAVIIAAALREGFTGPLFIQGDHFQVNAKKYATDPEAEVGEVKSSSREEVAAGFYNIDVDTSTLVDLSRPDARRAAAGQLRALRRDHRLHPRAGAEGRHGLGGRRDRRGGPQELDGRGAARLHARAISAHAGRGSAPARRASARSRCRPAPRTAAWCCPTAPSPQVKLDFDALEALSRRRASATGWAGAVQHGASHAAEQAFGNFPRLEACEIHLATNFQNMVFDHPDFPAELSGRIYALARRERPERAEGRATPTSSSTTRRARRRSGPSSRRCWSLPQDIRDAIAADLERPSGSSSNS